MVAAFHFDGVGVMLVAVTHIIQVLAATVHHEAFEEHGLSVLSFEDGRVDRLLVTSLPEFVEHEYRFKNQTVAHGLDAGLLLFNLSLHSADYQRKQADYVV